MTTKIKRKGGWKHLEKLMDYFSTHIYILPQEVVQRFALKKAPAVITPDDKLFKIQVFGRNQWGDL
jgi:hypothetical protein